MSKRKSYDVSFKLKAAECTVSMQSKEAAAREMGMNSKRSCEWCKQKEVLASLKKKGMSLQKLVI